MQQYFSSFNTTIETVHERYSKKNGNIYVATWRYLRTVWMCDSSVATAAAGVAAVQDTSAIVSHALTGVIKLTEGSGRPTVAARLNGVEV